MYSVEYYKTKKEKPTTIGPICFSENERVNFAMRRRYLRKLDMIEKCFNVKSLTVDLEDIYRISKDNKMRDLNSLIVKIGLAGLDDDVNAITIINNNRVNQLYIYSIINCEWMVDKDDAFDDINYLETVKNIYILMDRYNKEIDKKRREAIANEIELTRYFMDTHARKDNGYVDDVKSVRLGKRFIKKRKN